VEVSPFLSAFKLYFFLSTSIGTTVELLENCILGIKYSSDKTPTKLSSQAVQNILIKWEAIGSDLSIYMSNGKEFFLMPRSRVYHCILITEWQMFRVHEGVLWLMEACRDM